MVDRATRKRILALQSRIAPDGAEPTGAVRARGNLDPDGIRVIYALEQEYNLPDGSRRWYHIPIVCDNEASKKVVEELLEVRP